MANTEMTRGQWQAHIGSELFGTYYEMLVGQNPPAPVDVWVGVLPDQALLTIGYRSAKQLHGAPGSGSPDEWLLRHERELLRYTDLGSFAVRDQASLQHPLRVHMQDGLEFAHCMTMGSVVETLHAANLEVDRADAYRAAEAVLTNPQFGNVLGPLAITGFAVIGVPAMPAPGGRPQTDLRAVKERVLATDIGPAVELKGDVEEIADLQTVGMTLHPVLVRALRKALADQNTDIRTGQYDDRNKLISQHIGKPSFSSGCPVAHGGNTFGLMQQYLAETVRLTARAENLVAAV